MINLELYRIFFVVAEEGNITKASERLKISQPAVTKHIKNLESQLGSPLFIRTKRGVVLNEYGEKIFLKVKQALTLLDQAEKEINMFKAEDRGTIKIGISTTLTRKYLLSHIKTFHKLYPNILIDINTDPTKELLKKLKSGAIDLVIGKFPREHDLEIDYTILGESKYIFACGENYIELAKREKVKVQELADYPILLQSAPASSRESVSRYFKENNIDVDPKMNIASSNLLNDFLELGYGIGYVTKLYVEDELGKGTLFEINVEPETESIFYGIMFLKNNIMTSQCEKLVNYLKSHK